MGEEVGRSCEKKGEEGGGGRRFRVNQRKRKLIGVRIGRARRAGGPGAGSIQLEDSTPY